MFDVQIESHNIHLTTRERDVLRRMATGATNRQIAHDLTISTETVKTHVSNILRKMHASCRTEAVGKSYVLGMFDDQTGR